jgi:hypothetical protein
VKAKEVTRKQRAALERLPPGATANNAWTRIVIPTFINLVLSEDKPWASSETDLAPVLQNVWDHTFGSKEPYEVQKGTVVFELVGGSLITSQILIFPSSRLIKSYANTGMALRQKPSLLSTTISNLCMPMSSSNKISFKRQSRSSPKSF